MYLVLMWTANSIIEVTMFLTKSPPQNMHRTYFLNKFKKMPSHYSVHTYAGSNNLPLQNTL
jgi:hypothetical protein